MVGKPEAVHKATVADKTAVKSQGTICTGSSKLSS